MPSLRPSIDALRALSALFLYKALQPMLVMGLVLLGAGFVSMILLALSFSAWWWLLLVLLLPVTLIFVVLCYLMWQALKKLLPRKLADDEQEQLRDFNDKLFGIADRGRMPYPVLVFLVAKDVVRGKESQFLNNLIGDSKALTQEFSDIQELFKK